MAFRCVGQVRCRCILITLLPLYATGNAGQRNVTSSGVRLSDGELSSRVLRRCRKSWRRSSLDSVHQVLAWMLNYTSMRLKPSKLVYHKQKHTETVQRKSRVLHSTDPQKTFCRQPRATVLSPSLNTFECRLKIMLICSHSEHHPAPFGVSAILALSTNVTYLLTCLLISWHPITMRKYKRSPKKQIVGMAVVALRILARLSCTFSILKQLHIRTCTVEDADTGRILKVVYL